MRSLIVKLSMLFAAGWAAAAHAQPSPSSSTRPTIVLVHGAFADSSGWNEVISLLLRRGYPVIAVANPLRSVRGDAEYVASAIRSVPGDVVLVGHSYGGIVNSVAAANAPNVKSLVYVAGFAPDIGESAATISKRFPEGTLGQALAKPVVLQDGSKDLYIDPVKFWTQFAADVPKRQAEQMAASQRPLVEAALNEAVQAAAWKTLPSWFIYGSLDKNIPRSALGFMAKRAQSRETVEVKGASHVIMMSHPQKVAALIERAAQSK
jgi:pimeloyl-ACP methyl ester carboxylesterase